MFITNYNQITGRTLIIEEDENVGWAYITKPFCAEIHTDCWLYNKIDNIHRIDISKFKNMPPPAPVEVLIDGYVPYNSLDENSLSFHWSECGNIVHIYLNNSILAIIDVLKRESFNINLSIDCEWGKILSSH